MSAPDMVEKADLDATTQAVSYTHLDVYKRQIYAWYVRREFRYPEIDLATERIAARSSPASVIGEKRARKKFGFSQS